MKTLGLLALLTAAASAATEVPVWAYLLGIGLPGLLALLGTGRWYVNRRLADAQANTENANTELTEQQAEQIKEALRLSVLESVRDDMARQRQETARAQAGEKEAIAEVAILIAQHQRDRAEWKAAKHEYENTIRDQANQILIMRGEIESLREEVHTLRVALGVEQGRRIDDDRLTHLEHRADVSEADITVEQDRNTKIEQRADRAEKIADEQAHRNDDTPGHA